MAPPPGPGLLPSQEHGGSLGEPSANPAPLQFRSPAAARATPYRHPPQQNPDRPSSSAWKSRLVGHPLDPSVVERFPQPRHGGVAIRPMRDDLGDHRIIERRDHRPVDDMRIHANAVALRPERLRHAAGAGPEVMRRILGIDPAFDRRRRLCGCRAATARAGRPGRSGSAARSGSMPVTISVTGCSTWMRAFISRK